MFTKDFTDSTTCLVDSQLAGADEDPIEACYYNCCFVSTEGAWDSNSSTSSKDSSSISPHHPSPASLQDCKHCNRHQQQQHGQQMKQQHHSEESQPWQTSFRLQKKALCLHGDAKGMLEYEQNPKYPQQQQCQEQHRQEQLQQQQLQSQQLCHQKQQQQTHQDEQQQQHEQQQTQQQQTHQQQMPQQQQQHQQQMPQQQQQQQTYQQQLQPHQQQQQTHHHHHHHQQQQQQQQQQQPHLPEKAPAEVCGSKGQAETMYYHSLAGLLDSLAYITSLPGMCDVIFYVGKTRHPVYGVKSLLSVRSRVMYLEILQAQRFSSVSSKNRWRIGSHRKRDENVTKDSRLHIDVMYYDVKVFSQLIDFLHTGRVTVDAHTVLGLYCAAAEYEVADLRRACWDFVERCVQRHQAQSVLDSGRAYLGRKWLDKLTRQFFTT